MTKFRKKPVVIEAVPAREAIRCAKNDWESMPLWLRAAYNSSRVVFLSGSVEILTLEGTMSAGIDDWIICGVRGEIYPCKPDIFAATYDPVEEL